MGIAVSTATDVAKAAAGIVLTKPGLEGVVAAVKEGRITFQRILTYTLNSVTKKIVQVLFLAVGLIITGHAILTPMLMVLIMITGDFLGMALTTDNVRPSPKPSAWRVGDLTIAGAFMGISELIFCTAVLAVGKFRLGFGIETLQTLAFLVIVFGNQATTYTNRTRQRLWSTRPSFWLVLSSIADLSIASTMAGISDRHGASSFACNGRNPRRSNCLCVCCRHRQSPHIRSSEDHLRTPDHAAAICSPSTTAGPCQSRPLPIRHGCPHQGSLTTTVAR